VLLLPPPLLLPLLLLLPPAAALRSTLRHWVCYVLDEVAAGISHDGSCAISTQLEIASVAGAVWPC